MYSTGKKTHTGQYRGLRLFLRLLSRPRFRPSRGRRAGVSLGLDGCEVRLCDPCARVRPCVPCVPCVSRLPPVSFYRYLKLDEFDLSSPRDDPSDTTHAGAPKGGAALHGRSLRHKRQYCCGP